MVSRRIGHGSFFSRNAETILRVFALLAPVLLYGAAGTIKSNTNRVEDWLPSSFPETAELRWFRSHFVADQFLVISWEGCVLGDDPSSRDAKPDDPRIERLAQILTAQTVQSPDGEGQPTDGYGRYFKSVMTARRVLNELTSPPAEVPYGVATARLRGSLIGPDGRQTCVVVTLTDEAMQHLRDVIGRGHSGLLRIHRKPGLLYNALAQADIDLATVHMVGPPVDNVSIDEEGERTLVRLAGLSGLLGLGLAWWSLRSVKLTAMVFACGILSAALGLSAVWFTGQTADAVLMSMPSLVYVLAISGAVHLVNYYRDAVAEGGIAGAPQRAIAHGWKPALLCSVTTALGLLSLYASDLAPIRKFGLFSAVGVMGMLVVLFLFLPAALQEFPIRPRPGKNTSSAERGSKLAATYFTWFDKLWGHFGAWVIGHHRRVALACVLVIVVVGAGVVRVHTSIDLLKLFDTDARILKDYAWMEQHLGRLVPMELVLRFPSATQNNRAAGQRGSSDAAGQLSFLQRLETVDLVQRTIERRFGAAGRDVIGRTMSAVTFAPPLPSSGGGTLQFVRRSAFNVRLESSREGFERSGYLRVDPTDGAELWRISIRVAAFQDVDCGQFVDQLRSTVEPVMTAHEYRSRVFRQIASRRGSDNYAGATVLLWEPGQALRRSGTASHGRQSAVYDSLRELLRRSGVRVLRTDIAPGNLSGAQWAGLKKLDCVVLRDKISEIDTSSIRRAGLEVIPVGEDTSSSASPPDHAAAGTADIAKVSTVYTGVVPIVYKAQRALLDSLIQSTVWSFITITPLMMFVARSIAAGGVVMLPNALPVLVVFGGMGWLGVAVDIGSMMSASIALGVAVDDTIHFLTWFRDDLQRLGDRHRAILAAYRRCATPTLQAALISGLGLSVFALSTFTPTQRFGWLMLTILLAGVVAELVFFPALLAGPLGRVFRPPRSHGWRTWLKQHARFDEGDWSLPSHHTDEGRASVSRSNDPIA